LLGGDFQRAGLRVSLSLLLYLLLKEACKISKGGKFQKDLAVWWLVDDFVLEHPGEVVGDEDCVETGSERGIDVGARTVADHPGNGRLAGVVRRQGEVGLGVLFREDFDRGEVGCQAGAMQLVVLFFGVALGDQDDAMAGREVGEGFGDFGQEFDLLIGDGLGEADDAIVLLGGDGLIGELLEAGDERLAEAVETVALGLNGGVFDAVKVAANLFGGVNAVIEVGDERRDRPLEVDVVLPQGVVGVDEERLVDWAADGVNFGGHWVIISLGWRLAGGSNYGFARGLRGVGRQQCPFRCRLGMPVAGLW
jgi:hypothetical protein